MNGTVTILIRIVELAIIILLTLGVLYYGLKIGPVNE